MKQEENIRLSSNVTALHKLVLPSLAAVLAGIGAGAAPTGTNNVSSATSSSANPAAVKSSGDETKAIATYPTVEIPLQIYEESDARLHIAINKNQPMGYVGEALTKQTFTYDPPFLFEKQKKTIDVVGEVEKEILESLPEIAKKIEKYSDGTYGLTLSFNNNFKALRQVATLAVTPDDMSLTARTALPLVESPNIKCAWIKLILQESQEVVASGTVASIENRKGTIDITFHLIKEGVLLLNKHYHSDLTTLPLYRYTNIDGSFANSTCTLDLSLLSKLDSNRTLSSAPANQPLFAGEVDALHRDLMATLKTMFKTNDAKMLEWAARTGATQALGQLLAAEQTRTFADFIKEHPGIEHVIAEYLLPKIQEITGSEATINTSETFNENSSSQSVSAGGSAYGFSVKGGLTQSQIEQIANATGITVQKSKTSENWEIVQIQYRVTTKLAQSGSVTVGDSFMLFNEGANDLISAPAVPTSFTVDIAEKRLMEYGKNLLQLRSLTAELAYLNETYTKDNALLNELHTKLNTKAASNLETDRERFNKKKEDELSIRDTFDGLFDPKNTKECDIAFMRESIVAQRKEINTLLGRIYEGELSDYKRNLATYERLTLERETFLRIAKTKPFEVKIGHDVPHQTFGKRFVLPEGAKFSGVVLHMGAWFDNIEFLYRTAVGKELSTGRLVDGNEGGVAVTRPIPDDAHIVGFSSFYQGAGFDGWFAKLSNGKEFDIHKGGARVVQQISMPPLPEGWEWVLEGVEVSKVTWVNCLNTIWMPRPINGNWKVPEVPVMPTYPNKPVLLLVEISGDRRQ